MILWHNALSALPGDTQVAREVLRQKRGVRPCCPVGRREEDKEMELGREDTKLEVVENCGIGPRIGETP